ncbi:MAG: hypothetical protein LBB67_07600 [Oscillospiraceae bacterium]|jgi:hypothetical protein|nr:hypothetical protein [Oscillospiraceae bacterium]
MFCCGCDCCDPGETGAAETGTATRASYARYPFLPYGPHYGQSYVGFGPGGSIVVSNNNNNNNNNHPFDTGCAYGMDGFGLGCCVPNGGACGWRQMPPASCCARPPWVLMSPDGQCIPVPPPCWWAEACTGAAGAEASGFAAAQPASATASCAYSSQASDFIEKPRTLPYYNPILEVNPPIPEHLPQPHYMHNPPAPVIDSPASETQD